MFRCQVSPQSRATIVPSLAYRADEFGRVRNMARYFLCRLCLGDSFRNRFHFFVVILSGTEELATY